MSRFPWHSPSLPACSALPPGSSDWARWLTSCRNQFWSGFLNGMALSIALGQIGKIFGFSITKEGIVPRLVEFASKLGLTHLPTLAIGLSAFLVLAISPKVIPTSARGARGDDRDRSGGKAPRTRRRGGQRSSARCPPVFRRSEFLPFPVEFLPHLCAEAAGVALIGFSSMMLTARSFAAKNRYEIDVDREFAALGAANIAAALSQGFAVSGADSRTAMSDAAGGRTRVTGLVTAVSVAAVLLFFTGPLQYVPVAALGAVLVKAAFSLLDLRTLKSFLSSGSAGIGPLPAGHPRRRDRRRGPGDSRRRDPGAPAIRQTRLAAEGRDPRFGAGASGFALASTVTRMPPRFPVSCCFALTLRSFSSTRRSSSAAFSRPPKPPGRT